MSRAGLQATEGVPGHLRGPGVAPTPTVRTTEQRPGVLGEQEAALPGVGGHALSREDAARVQG